MHLQSTLSKQTFAQRIYDFISYGNWKVSKITLKKQKKGKPLQRKDASHSRPMMKSLQSTIRDLTRTPHSIHHSLPHQTQTHFKTFKPKETQRGKSASSSRQVGTALKVWIGFSMYKIKAGIRSLWSLPGHKWDLRWNSINRCYLHTKSGMQTAQLRALATWTGLLWNKTERSLKVGEGFSPQDDLFQLWCLTSDFNVMGGVQIIASWVSGKRNSSQCEYASAYESRKNRRGGWNPSSPAALPPGNITSELLSSFWAPRSPFVSKWVTN